MKKKILLAALAICAGIGVFKTAVGSSTEASEPTVTIYDYTYENEAIDISDMEMSLTTYEVGLIARMTMAEAEGESELGKRLVIDTILNCVDSPRFPNTVQGVIYQPGQFTPVTNGRLDRCNADIDICRLVYSELENRTNNSVIFFRTGCYSNYGVPLFKVGNHYFSGLG